ncbi:hypothetical protein [Actinoplanes sp. NPDC051851]|uniref:hypothetical protein n=1 Tax=Actinoplanes sp. NPDC051851 TaxID=3154753 RepID=UPI0034201774
MFAMVKIGAIAGGCAIALSLAACSSSDSEAQPATGAGSAAAATTAASAPATAVSTGAEGAAASGFGADIRDGRQFTFTTVQSGGKKALTVSADGVLVVTEQPDERSVFAPLAIKAGGDEYLMRTATKIDGYWYCLSREEDAAAQLDRLKITDCEPNETKEHFTFEKGPDGWYMKVDLDLVFADAADGKIFVQPAGEGDGLSTFTAIDKGEAEKVTLTD